MSTKGGQPAAARQCRSCDSLSTCPGADARQVRHVLNHRPDQGGGSAKGVPSDRQHSVRARRRPTLPRPAIAVARSARRAKPAATAALRNGRPVTRGRGAPATGDVTTCVWRAAGYRRAASHPRLVRLTEVEKHPPARVRRTKFGHPLRDACCDSPSMMLFEGGLHPGPHSRSGRVDPHR